MTCPLHEKAAIVTGASRGGGRAIALTPATQRCSLWPRASRNGVAVRSGWCFRQRRGRQYGTGRISRAHR